MYLTNEQTKDGEVLIRLTGSGFIATATFPLDSHMSESEPHENVICPNIPLGAQLLIGDVEQWNATLDSIISELVKKPIARADSPARFHFDITEPLDLYALDELDARDAEDNGDW